MKKLWILVVLVALVMISGVGYATYKQNQTFTPPPEATAPQPKFTTFVFDKQKFLILQNNYRTANGLPALTENSILDGTAQAHANDMQVRNYYEHTTPDGVTSYQRIAQALPLTHYVGENEDDMCASTDEPYELNRFVVSPEHKQNILDPKYTSVGIGYIKSNTFPCNGYLVIDFAQL